MSMTHLLKVTAVIAGVIGGSIASAHAQDATVDTVFTRFDFERFTLSTDPKGVLFSDAARPLGILEYSTSWMLNMQKSPLSLCVKGDHGTCDPDGDLVSSRFVSDLGLAVGFGIADARLVLPVIMAQYSDFSPNSGSDRLARTGMGDPLLGGRVALWSDERFAVAGDLAMTLPLNQGSSFIGNTGMTVTPRVLGEFRQGPIATSASVGYLWRYKSRQLGSLYVNDEVTWSVAAEYAIKQGPATAGLGLHGGLGLYRGKDSAISDAQAPGQEERPVEATIGGKYWVFPNLAVQAGVGRGLTAGYGAPAVRVLVGLAWNDSLQHTWNTVRGIKTEERLNDGAVPAYVVPMPAKPVEIAPPVPEPVVVAPPPPPPAPEPEKEKARVLESKFATFLETVVSNDPDLPKDLREVGAEVRVTPEGKPTIVITLSSSADEIKGDEKTVDWDKIGFARGSFNLSELNERRAQIATRILQSIPEAKVDLLGFSDATGSVSGNVRLSARRAQKVADRLQELGIAKSRIRQVIGRGPEDPIADNNTPKGRAMNRRVEIQVVKE